MSRSHPYDMLNHRKQLSLFLSGSERKVFERVRLRLDPVQSALIQAHLTLCREDEVSDWDGVWSKALEAAPVEVVLRLGPPIKGSIGGVFMNALEPWATFCSLREHLLGPDARSSTPHLTLLHPRNVRAECRELDLEGLADLPRSLTLRHLVMIEQRAGGAWRTVRSLEP